MSKASFSIDVEPARELVRVRMSGFFSAADVDTFQWALQKAHRQLDCARRGGPLTINDVGGMAIQSQDVAARWGEFLVDPAHRSRRLAFVVSSALARMQLKRLIGLREAEVFTDPVEAEQWLFA